MPEHRPRRTILSVDDHELVRVGLRQVIGQHFADRFHVAEAHNLEQALRFLDERADEVFLLLLDLNLGDAKIASAKSYEIADEPMREVSDLNDGDVMQIKQRELASDGRWTFPAASVSAVEVVLAA